MNHCFTKSNQQLGAVSPLTNSAKKNQPSRSEKVKMIRPHEIGPFDILCGRTSEAFNNVGNRRFRVTIGLNLKRYVAAPSRRDKTQILASIVDLLRDDVGARFLQRTPNGYQELGEKQCRDKVGHAFRDMVGSHSGTRASKQAKKTRGRPSSPPSEGQTSCPPSLSPIPSTSSPPSDPTTSSQFLMETVNTVVEPRQAQPSNSTRSSCWIDSTLEQVFLSMCEQSYANDFSLEPRPLLQDCLSS